MDRKNYVDNNVIKVVLTCEEGDFTGMATCIPSDKFDEEKGTELAYKRAMIQVKKADIDEFQKELETAKAEFEKYRDAEAHYRKCRKKLNKARKHLSDIYKDIQGMNL